ncbi:ribose-phosphate pyrophosphokinase [Candidatus Woesearchaeota archaeon]|nr:ribose-phosphate pyrophosphokinase [Candidatus Woesearchaeota archaeon]
MSLNHFKLISGTANRKLAQEVSKILGVPLTQVECKRFSDGELYCRILESVRGCNVFIIQPTSPDVTHNLMELLIMVDALKRSSPNKITAVVPYYGYARQDKKIKPREPITAKLVADMITTSGVDRLITFDLHVSQIQGFFNIPSDNMEILPLFAEYIIGKKLRDIVIVSPDAGGTTRARALAKTVNAPIAIVDKRRPEQNMVAVENIIGDVNGKTAILADDMIDTAGSVVEAAKLLKRHGAKKVYALATHAILSGSAIERLKGSEIEEIVVTNTIELPEAKKFSKLKVISVAPLLAETIRRTHEGTPVESIYSAMYEKLRKKVKK